MSPRAVIYARYSSHGQTEQSIEGQLHDNYAYAQQHGITIIGEYIDRALSGTKDQRPDFQRMIQDAAKKQFDLIIVWKLDRFARNRYDSAIYKAKLKKYGVRVISAKESITDSPEGIILEGLLESMAEYYSANLSQNVKRGQRENIEKGHFCGGNVPYGYRIQDKRLVRDDKTAPVLQYVFEQYAAGVPKKDIIAALNAKGIRNQKGKPLSITAFQTALSNPAYIGSYTYNGQAIPGLSERLISDDLFNQVQVRLRQTARAPAANKAKVDYLLQGKAFCGHCGAPMVGESGRSKGGNTYNYYACSAKKKRHTCTKKNEKKIPVETYIVQQTMKYVLTPARAKRIAKAVVSEYKKEFSGSRIDELSKSLQRIDQEMDKLVDALIDCPAPGRQKIHDRMNALGAQKADIENDLSRLRIASDIQFSETEILSWLKQFCNGDPQDESFRRRIVDVFINSVYLYDDRIVVFYNISGNNQVTYEDLSCSDLNASALPTSTESEHVYFVFVNGVFGCVYLR